MRKLIIFITILVFVFFVTNANAQLIPQFSADVVIGCSPILVEFTDESTGGTITSWQWDLGNDNTSSIQNPQATYVDPGTYTISLTVSDGTNTETLVKTAYITVMANPQPDFVSLTGTTGCSPYTVEFSDLSTASTSITSWVWDFGDGAVDNTQNPVHVYLSNGTFSVSLQVFDTQGCDSTLLINNLINVTKPPVASFPSDPVNSCSPPITVPFTNTSTGTGTLSYFWQFGDSQTSTEFEPVHNYSSFGQYDVTLIVTTDNNCSDTTTQPGFVEIISVNASYTTTQSVYCIGDSIVFNNTTIGGNVYNWDFGDGNISSDENPKHAYENPGTYNVVLIATVAGDTCTDTYQGSITIEAVSAGFSATPVYGCELPHTVQYTNESSANVVAWQWDFGDNSVSTSQNPSHSFISEGTFHDTLIVTTANGCKAMASIHDHITVTIPDVIGQADPYNGCAPLDVNFADNSVYFSALDSINSWSWDFGDGNSDIGKDVSNIYNEGVFTVTYTITTLLGCTHTNIFNIEAGTLPVPDFSVSDTVVCASDIVSFTDLSTDPALNNGWVWAFSDGSAAFSRNPSVFFRDTGYINVSFYVNYNGCEDSLIVDSMIYVNGPICAITFDRTCETPSYFELSPNLIDADRWYWEFGDGDADSSFADTAKHTYPGSGNYYAVLNAYNDITGCSYTDTSLIMVRNILADLTVDETDGCRWFSPNFDASVSQDEKTFLYMWNWGDGQMDTVSHPDTTHMFYIIGENIATLTVEDMFGCQDDTTISINVHQPLTDFSADTTLGCLPLTVNFQSNIVSDIPIIAWSWQIADSITYSTENSSHTFTESGVYSVRLAAWDSLWCGNIENKVDYIVISKPVSEFTSPDTIICYGDSVHFNAPPNYNYEWDFGDGDNSTDEDPVHFYSDTGFYSVILRTTDSLVCGDSVSKTDYIHIQDVPVVNFIEDTNFSECPPLIVQFTDLSGHDFVENWEWNLGDGTYSSYQNPIHSYTQVGLYSVSLVLNTTAGCSDTLIMPDLIECNGPVAEAEVLEDTICQGDSATFVVTGTQNTGFMVWDYGDGVFDTLSGEAVFRDTILHRMDEIGWKKASFNFRDSLDQCPAIAIQDSIFIHHVRADYSTEDSSFCVGYPILFNDSTTNADYWSWNFGDSQTSTDTIPVHQFASAGNYTVSLIASIEYGCADTITKLYNIFDRPATTLSNDTAICYNDTIQIVATGTDLYFWSPDYNISDDSISSPFISPDSNFLYTVIYRDSTYTCDLADSVNISIMSLPVVSLDNDTAICEKDTIPINAGPGYSSYYWSTNDSTQVIQAWQGDTIVLSVEDGNTCRSLPDTIIISIDSLPIVDLGPDTSICYLDTITFDGGAGCFSWEWHDNSTLQQFSVSQNDTIYVTVTDTNTCRTTSDTTILSVIPLPVANLPADTAICDLDTVLITPVGSYYSYLWSTNDTASDISAYTEDTITVMVSDSFGCWSYADTIIVSVYPLPVVDIGNDTSICLGDTIVFSESGYNGYLWNDFTTSPGIMVIAGFSINISLIVQDANTCWSLPDSLFLTIDTLPVVALHADTTLCFGDSLLLDAGAGYDAYEWRDSSDSQTVYIDYGDTAIVRIMNSYGCWSQPDSTVISIFDLPVIFIGNDTSICRNDSVLFDAGNGYDSYLWSTGDVSQTIFAKPDSTDFFFASVVDSNSCRSSEDTAYILVWQLPEINLGNDTSICDSDTLILDPGSGYSSYLWTDGSTGQTFEITSIDTIGVSVLSSDGCWSYIDSITISIDSLPMIDIGNDTSICFGDSLFISPGGGYSQYFWSTSDIDSLAMITTGDTVSVYVLDSNNCQSNTSLIIITIDSLPVADIDQNFIEICLNDSVILDAGAGYYSYLWNDIDTNQLLPLLPDTTTQVTLIVEDYNHCTSEPDTALIVVHNLPETFLQDSILMCPWDTIILDGTPDMADYIWSTAENAQTISVNYEGTIILIVKDTNHCYSIPDTAHVAFDSIPVINLGNDMSVCVLDTVVIDPDGNWTNYLWHDSTTDSVYMVTQDDSVYVAIQTAAMCWSYSDTISIHFDTLPVYEIGNDTSLCYLNGFVLDGGAGYIDYLWSDMSNNQMYTLYPEYSGHAWGKVKNSNNCWSLADSMYYEIVQAPVFEIEDSVLICPGTNYTLDAGSGYYAYYWPSGDSSQTSVINPGMTIVTVTDGACEAYDTIFVHVVPVSVNLPADTFLCDGEELWLDVYNENAVYSWSTGDDTPDITIYPWVQTIAVELTELFCTVRDEINIGKCPDWPDNVVNLPNAFSPNGDGYNDNLRVLGYEIDKIEFMVFNRFGKLVYQTSNVNEAMSNGWDGYFNGKLQESEVYVYYITATFSDSKIVVKKGNVSLIK